VLVVVSTQAPLHDIWGAGHARRHTLPVHDSPGAQGRLQPPQCVVFVSGSTHALPHMRNDAAHEGELSEAISATCMSVGVTLPSGGASASLTRRRSNVETIPASSSLETLPSFVAIEPSISGITSTPDPAVAHPKDNTTHNVQNGVFITTLNNRTKYK
jgi:hypothetical protein